MASTSVAGSIYKYSPSHVAAAVFAVLVGLSLLLHIYQNIHYRYWRVMFFMCWGGVVFTTGWIMRCISSYHPDNANLYIAQTVFILAGPPIYSAAEYNILGRLMIYVPMHAPLNPNRLVYLFIYLGAAVESLTAAGASLAAANSDQTARRNGGTLVSVALLLQAVVECIFMAVVATMHRRCTQSRMLPPNLRTLFVMLYGTSSLVLFRCIFRAIESFSTQTPGTCNGICRVVTGHEWYLYVFEGVPMVLYTWWLNFIYPGRFLPWNKTQYLDLDGKTERVGPGWIDQRSTWETFVDLFDLAGVFKGAPSHEKFWLRAEDWLVALGGSFALGTAKNGGPGSNECPSEASKDRDSRSEMPFAILKR